MDINNLEKIVEISNANSISKAAENLFISQSHLSSILKEIEAQLQFPIFERTNRGVVETKKGSKFLLEARNMLRQYNDFIDQYNPQTKQAKVVSISSRRSSYISITISDFVNELNQFNESILVRYQECTNQQVINNIHNGNSSIGLLRFDENYKGEIDRQLKSRNIFYEEIYECDTTALLSKHDPLASKDQIAIEDLHHYTEIIHGDFEDNYFFDGNLKNLYTTEKKIYVYDRGTLLDFVSNIYNSFFWTTATHPSILEKFELIEKTVKGFENRVIDYVIYKDTIDKSILKFLIQALETTIFELSN